MKSIGEITRTDIPSVQALDSVANVENQLLRYKVLVVKRDDSFCGLLTLVDVVEHAHNLVADCLSMPPQLDYQTSIDDSVTMMEQQDIQFAPVFLDDAFYGVCSISDILHHILADQLRERNQIIDSCFSISDALIVLDENDCIAYCTESALELLHNSFAELRGQEWHNFLVSTKTTEDAQIYSNQLHLHGHQIRFEFSSTPLHIGSQKCRIVTLVDLSSQKKLEEQYIKIEQGSSIRLLAGGIAHDFNNLLSGVIGSLELIRLETEIDPQLHQSIEFAYECASRAADLASRLVLYAKHGALVKEKTDLAALIKDNAMFVTKGSQVKLNFHFPEDLCSLEIDQNSFARVINNLVLNAKQALGPKGGRIDIWLKKVEEAEPRAGLPRRAHRIVHRRSRTWHPIRITNENV